MLLVDPEILAAGKGLSPALCGAGAALGGVLWLLGGRWHRFWLVLLITVTAGVYGLSLGEAHGVQPLVAALLLAVAAGALALSLVPVFAFLAGGVAGCLAGERLTPGWHEPFLFFFVGGFLGLLLLRHWMMALTSLAGTLLSAYSTLWLLDGLGKVDAIDFSAGRPVLINWACGGAALLGFLAQFALDRRRKRRERLAEDEDDFPREGRRLLPWLLGRADEPRRRRRAA